MRVIWKFRVMERNGAQPGWVMMPAGAIVRHVGTQDQEVFVWAEVDPEAPLCRREFVVHGTGHPIQKKATVYVGTTFDGPFVWHLYEVATKSSTVGVPAPPAPTPTVGHLSAAGGPPAPPPAAGPAGIDPDPSAPTTAGTGRSGR